MKCIFSTLFIFSVLFSQAQTAPSVFIGQTEMTPSGGQVFDEFYWLNTNNASLSMSGVVFPTTGTYRLDMSGYTVAGLPQIELDIDGVNSGVFYVNSINTAIFSLQISTITAGTHSITLKLINFSSGANNCRVGLVYFTQTTTATPPQLPFVDPAPLPANVILSSAAYSSGRLRGFNLGSNGYNQSNANGGNVQAMIDMVATKANIARCFVQIERPSGDTYQFVAGELEKLDSTIVRAARYGYYVVPCLFLDPAFNTDYWGNAARKASIAHLWTTIVTKYSANTKVAGYDLINEPRQNFNYAEVIRFEQQMIDTIRVNDANHVVMVECVDNDMFAMMLPLYQYTNVVYSPHGYSTLKITHQGVAGEPTANVRNKYPTTASTSNLTAPWGFAQITRQHDDVRTMSRRFRVPVFIGEFSCINWSPANGDATYGSGSGWTSTEWVNDNIRLLETEGWSWVYHAWRGDYPGWEAEIPSSYYNQFSFSNAAPVGLPSYNTWVANRSGTAPTIVMLKTWFARNSLPIFYINSISGNNNNNGTSPATAWQTLKTYTTGATYLLSKGGVYFSTISGKQTTTATPITISSYGSGAKPILSQFTQILSGWTQNSTNIWRVDLGVAANLGGYIPDISGEGNVGFLRVNGVIKPRKMTAVSQLAAQWDFFSDGTQTLFVFSNVNPATLGTIWCTTHSNGGNVVVAPDYFSISDVDIFGGGGVGVNAIQHNDISVRNIDMREIGGCFLGTGTTQYGEGVAAQEGCSNVVIDGNSIKQNYQACVTFQSHGTSPVGYVNCSATNNIFDSSLSGFNPSIETGASASNGYTNCRIAGNTITNMGYCWSHDIAPDAQSVAWLNNFWNTTQTDIILENNSISNPRTGLYYLIATAADPRYTTRYNTICMSPNIYIRRNCAGCQVDKYPYQLGGSPDQNQFTADEGYEVGSIWYDASSCGVQPVVAPQSQDPNDFIWFNQ